METGKCNVLLMRQVNELKLDDIAIRLEIIQPNHLPIYNIKSSMVQIMMNLSSSPNDLELVVIMVQLNQLRTVIG